jgi:hypothetical protein
MFKRISILSRIEVALYIYTNPSDQKDTSDEKGEIFYKCIKINRNKSAQ